MRNPPPPTKKILATGLEKACLSTATWSIACNQQNSKEISGTYLEEEKVIETNAKVYFKEFYKVFKYPYEHESLFISAIKCVWLQRQLQKVFFNFKTNQNSIQTEPMQIA